MKNRHLSNNRLLLLLCLFGFGVSLNAQYTHPGISLTKSNLDRIKQKVLAKEHPWIDGWNTMTALRDSRSDYSAYPSTSVSGADGNRQRASRDAVAAYYNILQWYVNGDVSHANCAINILNAWSAKITSVVTGELFQLPIGDFMQAAEIARLYPGWASTDYNRFRTMCRSYFYPACHDFCQQENSWPGWGAPANADILFIGIFLDDMNMVSEAMNNFESGKGGARIYNGILSSGQVVEMGRDIPHAEIGINSYADFCQAAYNQGYDLYSDGNNLLLKGFEYFNKFNLNHAVDWKSIEYEGHKFYYPATSNNAPWTMPQYRVYGNEMVYHHYADRKHIDAPWSRKMIRLKQNAILSGTLYNYTDTSTAYIHYPVPSAPNGLTASSSIGQINLKWNAPDGDVTNGYEIQRSENQTNGFVTIKKWTGNTSTEYVDSLIKNDKNYYYRVRASNQNGPGPFSETVIGLAKSGSTILPLGWTQQDIGKEDWMPNGVTLYDEVNGGTFVVKGSGRDIFSDSQPEGNFTYKTTSGDFEIITRVFDGEQNANHIKEKFGVMVRESLSASSAKVMLWLGDAGIRQAHFLWRNTPEGNGAIDGSDHTWIPLWMKFTRRGNLFEGFVSADGITWFSIGSQSVTLPSSLLTGIWVCGGAYRPDGYTVKFDHTSITESNMSGINSIYSDNNVDAKVSECFQVVGMPSHLWFEKYKTGKIIKILRK
jgi:hypothetical protein